MSTLRYQVWSSLELIPLGKVTTYGMLARFVGTKAIRAVASWVAKNPQAPKIPCHRVVLANGRVGQYSGVGGVRQKIKLLKKEGIRISASGQVVELERYLFDFDFSYLTYGKTDLVLASASPRRQALLSSLKLKFQTIPALIDESQFTKLSVQSQVEQLALAKAKHVANSIDRPVKVVGADTLVEFKGQALGKPKNATEARIMLTKLSGQKVEVFSGLAVVGVKFTEKGKKHLITQSSTSRVQVKLKPLSQKIIDWYVATGEPLDKAGAFAIQGQGATLIEEIMGDYFAVVGLSLKQLVDMLQKMRK